ncbi:MAG TPA: peptide transporter, partial [Armatimonadota bacterium]|nr:peptide transporter [Armatimonadota bacterium]
MAERAQADLEEYRQLLEVPDTFEEGFNLKLVLGAVFIGFVMMPASIYLSLVAGQGIGPAAQWTTLILFTEIAKRSFASIRKQEVFVLFYMAGGLAASGAAGTGPVGSLIWNQYLRQSPAAEGYGIADKIPTWVVPPADSAALAERTFYHPDWLAPIGLMVLLTILSKMNWLG